MVEFSAASSSGEGQAASTEASETEMTPVFRPAEPRRGRYLSLIAQANQKATAALPVRSR